MTTPLTCRTLTLLKAIQQHRFYLHLLSLLSALCFWAAWPPQLGTPLLFVALIPLLCIEKHIATHPYQRPAWTFYKYAYGTIFLWNLATTWWVVYATVAGAIFMLLVNSACLSFPLLLFYWTKKRLGPVLGYLSLVAYWISLEYMHLNWELSFPWLNWGNGFSCWPESVQWYEYTGTLGGTLWILVANIGLYHVIVERTNAMQWGGLRSVALWVILPISYSYYLYTHYQEQGEEVEVVVVQPNINPNTECFINTGELLSIEERVERFIELSQTRLTPQTQFLVWPESAVDLLFHEQRIRDYLLIDRLLQFRQQYPQLSLVTGINSLVGYENKKLTKTARFSDLYGYYDVFNTALFVGNQGTLDTYHKSKLVPGAEIIPFLYSVKVPKSLTASLEGMLRSMGMQAQPHVFFNAQGIGVAPIICYESIYGEHVARFIRKGASLIFATTIDGWWKNTSGYQQHFHYTRLRAIEGRKSVARSAFNGLSGFINQRGDVLQATRYEEQAVLKCSIQANQVLTFYVRHGDYIARIAEGVSFLLLIGTLSRSRLVRKTLPAPATSKGDYDPS